jgi:hypothetical protein
MIHVPHTKTQNGLLSGIPDKLTNRFALTPIK